MLDFRYLKTDFAHEALDSEIAFLLQTFSKPHVSFTHKHESRTKKKAHVIKLQSAKSGT